MKILIIKPSSLGDVTHTLPVLHLLRRRYPDAHISWLVAPFCAGLIRGHPDLNEVILFDRRRLGAAWYRPSIFLELLRFHRELRHREFDLVLDLQGLFRSGWMTWQTRSPRRIGFANAREFAPLFYTQRVPIETIQQHAVDRYLKLAAAAGCDTQPVEFHFPVTDADRRHVRNLLPSAERVAVLMPGANWLTKRWPAEKFAALVQPLREQFGLTSVVAGGADAAQLAPQIPGAINLAGKTNLPQLVALLEQASLVIANDSGPMHIAAALNRPLVALFGPTDPVRTGPYRRDDCVVRANLDCTPCFRRRCSHQICLTQLSIDPVLACAQRQLAVNSNQKSSSC